MKNTAFDNLVRLIELQAMSMKGIRPQAYGLWRKGDGNLVKLILAVFARHICIVQLRRCCGGPVTKHTTKA